MNQSYTCLPDYYLDPTSPWIKMPCDLSWPTRLKKVKYLAWLSKLHSLILANIISPNHSIYVCLFHLGWFSQNPIMLILTFVSLFSHPGIIKSLFTWARTRSFLLRWAPPPRNEGKSRNRNKKLAWWSALLPILSLQFLLMNSPLTTLFCFTACPCYLFCLHEK